MQINKQDADRFWSKVDNRSQGECWEWQGFIESDGYGRLTVSGKDWRSHRYSWLIANGVSPDGLVVCHRCDNRRCVNPDHLFLGTNAENMQDKIDKGRQTHGSRHGSAKLTEADIPKIVEAYNSGKSQTEVGALFGVSQDLVSRVLRREIWRHVDTPPIALRPAGGGNCKLTREEVEAIREAYRNGIAKKVLREQYGISRRHMDSIIGGEVWR